MLSEQLYALCLEMPVLATAIKDMDDTEIVFELGTYAAKLEAMAKQAAEQEQQLKAAATLYFYKNPDKLSSLTSTISNLFTKGEQTNGDSENNACASKDNSSNNRPCTCKSHTYKSCTHKPT